jgi:hypothetical protein
MKRVFSIAAPATVAFLLVACSASPKRPLQPGYYIFDERSIGVTRRIIIVAGERRASYDVWRVSSDGDGMAKHALSIAPYRRAGAAAEMPNLYRRLGFIDRFFYSELNPRCTFD